MLQVQDQPGAASSKKIRSDLYLRFVTKLGEIAVNAGSLPSELTNAFTNIQTSLSIPQLVRRQPYRFAPDFIGPVPIGSPYYVRREILDGVLAAELKMAPDIRLCLYGAPGTGKGSAVGRAIYEMKRAGIKVAQFTGGLDHSDSNASVLTAIARRARAGWSVDFPIPPAGIEDSSHLARWLMEASALTGDCVLVCDRLERLVSREPQVVSLPFAQPNCRS